MVGASSSAERVCKIIKGYLEACEIVREKLDFRGEHYTFTLMTPDFVPESEHFGPVPITIVGPHTLRLAGEICDGVRLHPFCTRSYLENVAMKRIEEGLAASSTKRENFQVTGGGSRDYGS